MNMVSFLVALFFICVILMIYLFALLLKTCYYNDKKAFKGLLLYLVVFAVPAIILQCYIVIKMSI